MEYLDFGPVLLIILTFFVLLLLIFLLFAIYKFYKMDFEKKNYMLETKAYKAALEKLRSAHEVSLKVVEDTNAKATEIIKDAQYLSENAKEELAKSLRDVSNDQKAQLEKTTEEALGEYTRELKSQKEKNIQSMNQVAEEIKSAATNELEEFKSMLHNDTVDYEKKIEEKLTAEQKILKERLDAYKNEKIRKIDKSIASIVVQVSKDVIGKSIDLDTSQKLVFDALESAKKENLFE